MGKHMLTGILAATGILLLAGCDGDWSFEANSNTREREIADNQLGKLRHSDSGQSWDLLLGEATEEERSVMEKRLAELNALGSVRVVEMTYLGDKLYRADLKAGPDAAGKTDRASFLLKWSGDTLIWLSCAE